MKTKTRARVGLEISVLNAVRQCVEPALRAGQLTRAETKIVVKTAVRRFREKKESSSGEGRKRVPGSSPGRGCRKAPADACSLRSSWGMPSLGDV